MSRKIKSVFFFCSLFLFFITFLASVNNKKFMVYAERNIGCSEIVIERDSGRVLYENNADDKKFMASTTKILTALTVINNCDVNEEVVVDASTVGVEGSSIYLEVGEKLSVKDLLYGLMLRSGNDAAETLAVHCCGSIDKFAEKMNKKANELGAKNSHFVNPHGLHDDNHYTTARDLAIISVAAMKNDIFREIVSCKEKNIPYGFRQYPRHLVNKNKMLFEFDGANGIKTGFTKKAGRCLVSSCKRDGMELICVVLNCPPMFERSKKLLSDGFKNYKLCNVLESDYIIGFIDIGNNGNKCAVHIKEDIVLPLSDEEREKIKIEYCYPDKLDTIPEKNSEIGFVKIYCENKLLFLKKIYTI